MTINPQKLLPPSKLSTPAGRMSVPYDNKVDDVTNLNVKRKLINVDKFLKNSYTQKKKEEDKKKRKKQSETRQEKETKLETPKGIKGIGKIKSLIPATGILDAVQKKRRRRAAANQAFGPIDILDIIERVFRENIGGGGYYKHFTRKNRSNRRK